MALASETSRARFESKVQRGPGCWEWQGMRCHHGYAYFGGRGAHRLAYELWVGPIPAGLTIDHLCRNRGCVNPTHLEAVTILVNNGRRPKKTHCPNGHEYTPENTYRNPQRPKSPICRICHRDRRRTQRHRDRHALVEG